MTAPVDPKLAAAAAARHDLVQRKIEMDALRGRLRNDPTKEQKLREACEGFESIFVQKMWEQMRATLPKEGYLHSKEEEFWQSMFDQELAKKMTSAGGIGLADMIYEQLSARLTDASRTTAPGSVREPMPLKALSLVPHLVTVRADGVKSGGRPAASSSMYEPASPEAPVAAESRAAEGTDAGPTGLAGSAGHDLVRRQLVELERQVAAAPAVGGVNPAAPGIAAAAGVPVQPAQPTAPATVGQTAAVSSPVQRRTARGMGASAHGLPAAASGDAVRKVRSPMRDGVSNPPIVHRTGATKRMTSPASAHTRLMPANGPSAADPQADAGAPGVMSGNALGAGAPSSPAGAAVPTTDAALSAPTGAAPVAASLPDARTATPLPGQMRMSAAGSSPTGGPSVAAGTPGAMTWPHEGRIASGFGWRNDPLTGERAWHPGVDIAVAEGDAVRAAWDGKVVFAGERADYGTLVVLEHSGGWRSFYGHNGSLDVREGEMVLASTKIAKAGGTGRAAGPHLHFEVRQGELAVNPEYTARSLASGGGAAQRIRSGG